MPKRRLRTPNAVNGKVARPRRRPNRELRSREYLTSSEVEQLIAAAGGGRYKGRDQTLRYLLERGASVNANVDNGTTYVNTPLMMAAIMGHLDTTVMLLNAGAAPRVRVRGGLTARDLALKNKQGHVARELACSEKHGPGDKVGVRC